MADIEEGKNAGTWTEAVLSGSQTEEILKEAEPDFILAGVVEIPRLFDSDTGVGRHWMVS